MYSKALRLALYAGFGLSGMAALIYEVVWTRSLSTIMGSSTYALSTMLAAFMAGLATGGWIGSVISDKSENPARTFAILELTIGITGLLTIPLINSLTPLYMLSFYSFNLSFNTFSIVQFLICFLIMGIPTTFMGLTFPFIIKVFATGSEDIGRKTGRLYSINTFGAIIGSIAAGFILIPLIGAKATVIVAAAINITTALVILTMSSNYRHAMASAMLTFVFIFIAALAYKPVVPFFSYYSAQRFKDYNFARQVLDYTQKSGKDYIIYEHEGIDGSVYLSKSPNPREKDYVLINNGKYEGGNDIGFALLAYLPFISHEPEERKLKALNIGLGSGHTLKHLAKLPFEFIDSVELSAGVLEANSKFLSPQLFNIPTIRHHVADGRNFLLLGAETYDIIVTSPSWAVETSSAGLLTKDFFSLAYNRLHWHGVFAVWLDDFLEGNDELNIIMRSMRDTFEHVELWETPGGKVLVGSKSELLHSTEAAYKKLRLLMPELEGNLKIAMNEDEINALPEGLVNTDDKPVIEFSNARNILKNSQTQH